MDKIKIDTLIISDIHLGGYHARCREILELLRRYDFHRLILNGDILEGLRFQRLDSANWEVLSRFRKLSANHEVVWVHGNHDAKPSIISNLLGIKVYSHYIWNSHGKKFLAIHGHQFDKFLINNYILSHIVYFFYNLLKRIDVHGLLTRYIKENNRSWKRSSHDVASKAIQTARLLGADFVFCGHTHRLMQRQEHGVTYYNGASWNERPSGFITIKDGIVELIDYDKDKKTIDAEKSE